MKQHTDEFRNSLKTIGRHIDAIVTYSLNGQEHILDASKLLTISPIVNGGILKSVMKQLDFESTELIPSGTVVNLQIGVQVDYALTVQDVHEMQVKRLNTLQVNKLAAHLYGFQYLNYGNYIIKDEPTYNADTQSYSYTCYDKMLYSMVDYENMNITYPITIRDYINTICTHLGLTFKDTTTNFANYNKEIQNELYLSYDSENNTFSSLGYTYRDVLDELAQVTASTICINEATDELEIRYITETNDSIDEEFLKDVNVTFGKKYGAVNTIVLSRSAESDNIYYPEILPQNPCEIKIVDNQIMNWNDRSDYLPAIYNKLNGLEFYINDFSSTGILWYELCDMYSINIGEEIYKCVLLNDEVNIQQGLEELIYTDMPSQSVTDYTKADKTDRRINQAYIIVNKQEGTINSLVLKTDTLDLKIDSNYTEITTKFNDFAPKSEMVVLETSVEQLTTNTYTKTEVNTKLRDGSVEKVLTTAGTFDENGLTIEKTGAKTKGTFNETGIKVKDATSGTDEELLFAGYDEDINETIVRTKNLTVEKYLTIKDVARQEKYVNPVLGGYGIGTFIL